jgi:hypothetical protein
VVGSVVAAWEFWLLSVLGVLQLYVAHRWWTGPHLEGTRFWVAALFALNGTYTVLRLSNTLLGGGGGPIPPKHGGRPETRTNKSHHA